MFKYVGDISKIAQNIISFYCSNFNIAVDATLGNGYDTDFLCEKFNKVYSFDIQKTAIENYLIRKKDNVILINDSHEKLSTYIKTEVGCIMYNLGFLPGGNKNITTKTESTISSIKEGLYLLCPGGIMSIAIYTGHDEGIKEKDAILNLVSSLSKKDYGVLMHSFINRSSTSPLLVIVEKNGI
ncbi:class I SAM-dependent methyltransferase [Clostridium sp. SYSU_GA19001]|uniref:tRNA (mnm(5)s(2)U34)-methyltransferase n=1 Tax=Clostridium caldaquaticum TaxID=2940653 RepID=UPI00207741B7|nr:class I SAM-dependent methyltransferase [Clostridium caldaquaticum]MCM8710667.1 class I SAM-dependent methyltransferase [Clostridium caldaquaticum]